MRQHDRFERVVTRWLRHVAPSANDPLPLFAAEKPLPDDPAQLLRAGQYARPPAGASYSRRGVFLIS